MRKILIVAPAWVGDAILAQPLFRRLHALHSDLTLDVCAPTWTLPVFARMPEINAAIAAPFQHGEFALRQRRALGHRLATEHYNQAIVLPNSFKSALVPWFSGIPLRTGFVGEARWLLLNDARRLDKLALPRMAERFALLAEARDEPLQRPLAMPRLEVNAAQRAATLAKCGVDTARPVVALCPGAEYGPAKRWPPQYFAQLAIKLSAQGYAVWLIGSKKDVALGAEIVQLAGNACRNLCGNTSLDEAIDLLSCTAFVVSNDSGLMHVAAALGKPLIALYGSSSPTFTPPLSDTAQIVRLDLPCSPCFQRICPLGHFNCMMQLTPEHVWQQIDFAENAGAMKRVIYATAQDTESAFYDALEKSDLDTMMSVWADDDDIVCVHPGGVRSSGVAQVREAWRRIFAGGQQLQFRLQYQQVITSGTLAVHSIYEEISIIGEKRTLPPIISTNIYLRTEHGWRMIVHHASAAPAAVESDPRRAPKILH